MASKMNNHIDHDSQIFPIEHNIGDIVYVKTDANQLLGIVTGYQFRGNCIIYLVSQVANEYPFNDYELTIEPDQLLKSILSNNND
jgi:hypothetical protein